MKRVELIIENEKEFRLNRLACQHPLCFPPTYKLNRFVINMDRKNGLVLMPGGKDKIGHFNRKGNKRYAVGMALSDAEQFLDRGENPLPGEFDHKILMGLIYLATTNNQYYVDFKSTYAILKALALPISETYYGMLWNSFDKWSKTSIMYQKNIRIYNGNKATTFKHALGISNVICSIDSYWNSDKDEEEGIHIEFTKRFIDLLGIKFSAQLKYETVLQLKGTTSKNLYLYLKGAEGYLKTEKGINLNIRQFCINKLAISGNTRIYRMKDFLEKSIKGINKKIKTGKYILKFKEENVIIKYNDY